jgi:UDP-glucose:(heptosyl)LPS alpha-1,3-glucosyltransferase
MMQHDPSRLRVALVIEQFDPRAGGAERSTAQIAAELLSRGHQVAVITAWCPDHEVVPGVHVVSLDQSLNSVVGLWRFSRWATRQLAEGGYDATMSVTMAVPAMVLQPRGGTIRETLDRNVALRRDAVSRCAKWLTIRATPKYQAQLAIERRTLMSPAVRRIVAVSQYVADQLARHYRVDESRIDLIPNAAVMPEVDARQREAWRAAVRRGFNVPDDATVFLFVANNPRLKGYDPLLEALRALPSRDVSAVTLLAGELWYSHQAQAVAMGVRDTVRFVRQTRNVAALYAAADATVLPTFYDPSSKVVIESLMMGTPAISTGYNGASDFLTPADAPARGIVVREPWDVAGLTEAMSAMADEPRRRAMAEATRGLAGELSMSRHVDRLEAVLRRAADEAAADAAHRAAAAATDAAP